MGLTASSGIDNDDLVDKLVEANIIVSHRVETVLRLVDRGRFFPKEGRDMAYKDLAWKSDTGSPGRIHISAPCIYANVLECLDLVEGNNFLNIGSGTGYLNTVAGYLLGSTGTNHGIEIYRNIVQYARRLVKETLRRPETQCFDWAVPEFTCGNGLCLSPAHYGKYDRVYCGATVPSSHRRALWELMKIGGILVMPYDDQLQQVRRKAADVFEVKIVSSVSYSDFILPTEEETAKGLHSNAPSFAPVPTLQYISAAFIRKSIRTALLATHEIHIRNYVSQQPKRARDNHAIIEYRDGEPFPEVHHGNRAPFREIYAIVGPDLEHRDDENEINDRDVDLERDVESRRLAREQRRIEWYREQLRAHVANRAVRRRRLREAQANGEVNVVLEDIHDHDTDHADLNDSSSESISSSAGSTPSSGTSQDFTETNSDGSSSSAGRSKKRLHLELEGESSSAKRRNDDDGESSSEEVTVGLFEYETVHGIGSYVSSEEDMPEAKERSSRAAEEILIQPEAKDDCEENLMDEMIEQSKASLGQESEDAKGIEILHGVKEGCKEKITVHKSGPIEDKKITTDNSSSQLEECAEQPQNSREHSLRGELDVHKLSINSQDSINVNNNVKDIFKGAEVTSKVNAEINPLGGEMKWQNSKLFRSKETNDSENRNEINTTDGNSSNTKCSSHQSDDSIEAGKTGIVEGGTTSDAQEDEENSGDGNTISSSSADLQENELDYGSGGDEQRFYSAAREVVPNLRGPVIGIEQAANDHGAGNENSDISDDGDYQDAVEDDISPPSRPDMLQAEEGKKREEARLKERERQLKDIEECAHLFEFRLMELPLNGALKNYVKYLCK